MQFLSFKNMMVKWFDFVFEVENYTAKLEDMI